MCKLVLKLMIRKSSIKHFCDTEKISLEKFFNIQLKFINYY